jgi:phosphoribosylformylglycinamidine synthase I
MEMDQVTSEIAGSAVQIGHPINEKQVLEVVLQARDARLYHAITDCGAGGLSSAVGEMARPVGARVQLDCVPLKYPGLRPWEIWLSEAQERMVLAIPLENWPRFQQICEAHGVEAVSIGTLEATERLRLFFGEKPVGDLTMDFLHDGLPRHHLKAIWTPPQPAPIETVSAPDLTDSLLKLLAHPNIASKEPVIRRYDHEVQSGTAVKPLVGVDNHGPSDAAVLVPLDTVRGQLAKDDSTVQGVALSTGIGPAYGERDPYLMAWAAVDEAMRNIVAVGADPDRVALLDNFCWGSPTLPDRLGGLVRCALGCHDAAIAYNTPFISGKDSLNNEYSALDGTRHAIPGTLLISAIGIVPDVSRSVTMDLKRPGNRLYIVGDTRAELGGSHFELISCQGGGAMPEPIPNALDRLRALHRAIAAGLVDACHDCSEGGIGVALAEMCLAGRLGATLWLDQIPGIDSTTPDAANLFSESLCRFIVEISAEHEQAFIAVLEGVPHGLIGMVEDTGTLAIERSLIRNGERELRARITINALETAWRGTPEISTPVSTPPLTERANPERQTSAVGGTAQVLILHTVGTNRDRDAALACELAGAAPEIVTVAQLLSGERNLADYHMLVVPGGFSYGDDLGAGKVWALDLQHRLADMVGAFVQTGRPVLGICNGFQALVKAGLLPGHDWADRNYAAPVTLTYNASGHFECRWVKLWPNPNSPSIFTEGIDEPIYCPVAHGEGRLVVRDDATRSALWNAGLAPLIYVDDDHRPAGYPGCPNGSDWAIAGLCNPAGNVVGLMPHPENHIFPWQHPRWQRGERGMSGLRLFENGIRYARR